MSRQLSLMAFGRACSLFKRLRVLRGRVPKASAIFLNQEKRKDTATAGEPKTGEPRPKEMDSEQGAKAEQRARAA
jgi:hypothetical protein